MKRFSPLLLILLAALLTACAAATPTSIPEATATLPPPTATAQASPTPTAVTVNDALGRQVTLPALRQRIAIVGRAVSLLNDAAYLFPEAIERVVSAAATPQGGSGDFIALIDPNLPQKTAFQTQVGPEQVITAQPDLALMKPYMAETLGKPLEALGVPVVYLSMETPEEFQRDVRTLGQIFGNPERAEDINRYYQQQVDAVTGALASLDEAQKPRTLLLYYSDRDGQVAFNVAPNSWIQTWMAQTAGGRPVWTEIELGSGWTKVNLEQIAAWDADAIFIINYTGDPEETVARLRQDPQWQAMRAVREGRLYAFPRDYYSWDQADPRWILGLRWLAFRLHPEAFPALDMINEAKAFFAFGYGIDETTFNASILPLLKGDLR